MTNKNSLGCGKRFKLINGKMKEVKGECDFICGVADGWGKERLCLNCENKNDRKSRNFFKRFEGRNPKRSFRFYESEKRSRRKFGHNPFIYFRK